MFPLIRLDQLSADPSTQLRLQLDPRVVAEYAAALQRGDGFPPIIVFQAGDTHLVADGHHRVAAARLAGLVEFPADVRAGTRRDAVLCAAGANAQHGLRRTNADKRRAVETLLRDPEWAAWSDRELARRCAVDHGLVRRVRAELCGAIPQMPVRKVQRGGTEYTQRMARRPLTQAASQTSPAPTASRGASTPSLTHNAAGDSNIHCRALPPAPGAAEGQVAPHLLRKAEAALTAAVSPRSLRPGEWWITGRHRVFVGTDPEPSAWERLGTPELLLLDGTASKPPLATLLPAALAPPRVAVLTTNSALPEVLAGLTVSYQGTVALLPDVSAAGAVWYPLVLAGAPHGNGLEVLRVPGSGSLSRSGVASPGLTLELACCLLEALSHPDALVLAGGRGGEAVLLAAELTGRSCALLSSDPRDTRAALSRWETLTGTTPALAPLGRI